MRSDLEQRLATLYEKLDQNPQQESVSKELASVKSELEILEKHEASGSIFSTFLI